MIEISLFLGNVIAASALLVIPGSVCYYAAFRL